MIGPVVRAGGWLVGLVMGRMLVAKLLIGVALVAVPVGAGAVWYAKHVYEGRAQARQEAEAFRSAALAWSRQWAEQRDRQAATEALRVARERERDAIRRQFQAARGEIARLRRENQAVDEYLRRAVPDDLDRRLCDAEAAAGAAGCRDRLPAG